MKFVSQMPQNEVMPSRAQMKKASLSTCFFGGDGGDRTHDLLNAIQALSQLSYAPKFEVRSNSEEVRYKKQSLCLL